MREGQLMARGAINSTNDRSQGRHLHTYSTVDSLQESGAANVLANVLANVS